MDEPVAVVLAGGRSRRFGSDKLITELDGRTLLDHALEGLPPSWLIIVVGPARTVSRPVSYVTEDPPDGGPGAALVTGARAVIAAGRTAMVTMPGDAPYGGRAARLLWRHAGDASSGALVATDAAGRDQPLQLVVRDAALLRLAAHPDPTNVRARDLLALLDPLDRLPLPAELTDDIDTREQADHWAARTPDRPQPKS